MSHYAKYGTMFGYKQELVEALLEIYPEVEVNMNTKKKNNLQLKTWDGMPSTEMAEIVVRKKYLGKYNNDLGFAYNKETGKFTAIVDAAMKKKIGDIVPKYVEKVIKNRYRAKYRIKRTEGNQTILQRIGA